MTTIQRQSLSSPLTGRVAAFLLDDTPFIIRDNDACQQLSTCSSGKSLIFSEQTHSNQPLPHSDDALLPAEVHLLVYASLLSSRMMTFAEDPDLH